MVYIYIMTMALVTYLIRMLPLTVYRKKIENRTMKSFLHYVPYTCLTAMTFPGILYSTGNIISAAAGFLVALILGFKEKSLIVVAAVSCVAVYICEAVLKMI